MALAVAVLAALMGAGGGCDTDSRGDTAADRKYARECAARGRVPHIRHRGNATVRSCDPAPRPTPRPGNR